MNVRTGDPLADGIGRDNGRSKEEPHTATPSSVRFRSYGPLSVRPAATASRRAVAAENRNSRPYQARRRVRPADARSKSPFSHCLGLRARKDTGSSTVMHGRKGVQRRDDRWNTPGVGTADRRRVRRTRTTDTGDSTPTHRAISTNDEGVPGYRAASTRTSQQSVHTRSRLDGRRRFRGRLECDRFRTVLSGSISSRSYLNTTSCGDDWELETGPATRVTAALSPVTALPTRETRSHGTLRASAPSRAATVGTVGVSSRTLSTGLDELSVQIRDRPGSAPIQLPRAFRTGERRFPPLLETTTPFRSPLVRASSPACGDVMERLDRSCHQRSDINPRLTSRAFSLLLCNPSRAGQPFVDRDRKEPTVADRVVARVRDSRRIARRSFAALPSEIERRRSIHTRRRRIAWRRS